MDKERTPTSAVDSAEQALKVIEGKWKLVIVFHLFGGKQFRFSELEKVIPAITQKMKNRQLCQMEIDGVVRRIVHHQMPLRVEYRPADWGQALCPTLDALLKWSALREGSTPRKQLAIRVVLPKVMLFIVGMAQAGIEGFPADQRLCGVVPLNSAGHVLHAATGTVILYLGLAKR